MMHLLDLIDRQPVPEPWSEGDNIPWNDPDFSRQMLKEHLSQEHDAASRRLEKIDQHVAWIHHSLLQEVPAKILDLGCGPGLYTSRLSKLGHDCVGVDFSPASIQYAVDTARTDHLRCAYLQGDLRSIDFGAGFDLAMQIFGELNVFKPADARLILAKANRALSDNGQLLLEPHPFTLIQHIGEQPATWYSSRSGLFSDQPHLCLTEHFWQADRRAATIRHFVVDAATGQVTRHAQSLQAYTDEEYQALLTDCGFGDVKFYAALGSEAEEPRGELMAIVARKQHTA